MSAGVKKKKHGKEAILAEKSWKRGCKSSCCNGSLIISFLFFLFFQGARRSCQEQRKDEDCYKISLVSGERVALYQLLDVILRDAERVLYGLIFFDLLFFGGNEISALVMNLTQCLVCWCLVQLQLYWCTVQLQGPVQLQRKVSRFFDTQLPHFQFQPRLRPPQI